MRGAGGRDKGNVSFLSQERNKEPVCDVKVNWMKTESGPGHPVAGESLNRPDESKLSSVRFLLSPLRKLLRSPSSVSLFARHLLPFGRRLLLICGFHETWPVYLTIADRYERQMHSITAPWHADEIGAGRAQHDQRGKMKNHSDGVYSEPSDSSFSLPRGRDSSAAFQFDSIDFYVTVQLSLVLSWAPRKYRTPFVPHRSFSRQRNAVRPAAVHIEQRYAVDGDGPVQRVIGIEGQLARAAIPGKGQHHGGIARGRVA